eukprot:CAMPEP_0174237798 /NCGR_PEP_ID=MMETSP0417-20130205/9358_1 /TAXON_ID=242541 /ORGANISM="Mayorella sp, Strain BSH-02190019" /LENGTH=282 /DNA_ID=CAMNT_0015316583 /DNA_START=161 /DNA_END=1005 /DNA_ORIENTATION=-
MASTPPAPQEPSHHSSILFGSKRLTKFDIDDDELRSLEESMLESSDVSVIDADAPGREQQSPRVASPSPYALGRASLNGLLELRDHSSTFENRFVVMVAVDGSHGAYGAFFAALEIVNPKNDVLLLASILQPEHVFGEPTILDAVTHKHKEKDVAYRISVESEARVHALHAFYIDLARAKEVDQVWPVWATSHKPGAQLCEWAAMFHVSYLLMGRRGMSPLSRRFLGSVSQYCIKHSPCLVAVVKGHSEKRKSEKEKTTEKEEEQVDVDCSDPHGCSVINDP